MYSENGKTLMKEIEGNTHRGKDTPCSRTGRINNVKMTVLPKEV